MATDEPIHCTGCGGANTDFDVDTGFWNCHSCGQRFGEGRGYWDRMVAEGFWDEHECRWTPKGIKEMLK